MFGTKSTKLDTILRCKSFSTDIRTVLKREPPSIITFCHQDLCQNHTNHPLLNMNEFSPPRDILAHHPLGARIFGNSKMDPSPDRFSYARASKETLPLATLANTHLVNKRDVHRYGNLLDVLLTDPFCGAGKSG